MYTVTYTRGMDSEKAQHSCTTSRTGV